MTVPAKGRKPCPFRFLSVVDFDKRHCLLRVIGPSSHDDQISADKRDQMLVSAKRSVCFGFGWGDPVPGAVSVLT